jgi:hypothetical protein
MVAPGIAVDVQPTWPIFEKCSHLREKGVLMLLKTTPHLGTKAQYDQCVRIVHTNKPTKGKPK